jgi:hypothetical protein
VILDPDGADDEPKPLWAVSVPLKSFDAARANAEKENGVTAIRPGVVRVTPKKNEKEVCDLTVAAGEAQGVAGGAAARAVCGDVKGVEALREWFARGVPRLPPEASAFTASLRAGPLKDRYLGKLRAEAHKAGDEARSALTAQNVGDPDLLAAPGVALEEGLRFLEDVDRLEIRSTLVTTPPEIQWSGSLRFGGKTSWLTRVLTDVNDRSGPVPELFWHAPRDAYSATWGRGADPHLFTGIRGIVHKALEEALGRIPLLPAGEKAAIEAFVDGVPKSPGAWVSSSGILASHKKPGAKPDPLVDARDIMTMTLGWHVTGLDAPSTEYVAWARQGLDLYNHLVHLAKEFAGAGKALAGKGGGKKSDPLELIPKIKEVKSPPGWPKGTVAFDVLLNFDAELAEILLSRKAREAMKDALKDKKTAKVSMTLRLAIVPDGDHTWIGFSADLDELKKRLNAVIAGAPKPGTLAAREGLDELKQPGQTWGGFIGIGEILERTLETLEREDPKHTAEAKEILASLPNKGKTPLLLIGTGTGGGAPSSSVEVRLQSGTLADAAGLVTFLLSPRGKELLDKVK